MPNFIINKNAQSNGDHEVHNLTNGCDYMPESNNQIMLGFHLSCHEAVSEAKKMWPTDINNKINGCYYCCNDCHTS